MESLARWTCRWARTTRSCNRSGALTDINFYEMRYAGRPAAFLRGFRAIYLGVFFNVMIMATVTLAAIKIAGVLLGLDPYVTVVLALLLTTIYAATAGLWGVVMTDLVLFVLALVGSIAAAYYALAQPEVGGLSGLISNPLVHGKLSLLPDFSDPTAVLAVLIIPTKLSSHASAMAATPAGLSTSVARVVDFESEAREKIGEALTQAEIEVIDGLPSLERAVAGGEPIARDTIETHYNARGYIALATAVKEGLELYGLMERVMPGSAAPVP